jgi:hypothetical protein
MMFEDSELFKQLAKAVTGKDIELIDAPFSQISKREAVTLSSIRFDLFAKTTQGVFSIDMQRSNSKDLLNRIIFYACRMISSQDVIQMRYSDVLPVNVSFIMSEKPSDSKNAIRYVKTTYTDTGETFSELLNIALVYVPTVLKTVEPNSAIRIFSEFFSIQNNFEAEIFENRYKDNDLGVKLMDKYRTITFNEEALKAFAKEPYFTEKDYIERDKERIRELAPMVPLEKLASVFNIPLNEVRKLAE